MLFFVWSLVSSAVQNARRKRLLSILRLYMATPFALRSALVCRRLSSRFNRPGNTQLYEHQKRLFKTPSEPVLNDDRSYETILYHTENVEILSTPYLNFNIDEWAPAFRNKNQLLINTKDIRVFFITKIAPSLVNELNKAGCSASIETVGVKSENQNNESQFYLVENFANRIACKRRSYGEEHYLYETTINNFYMLIIYWTEGTLRALHGGFEVLEISSIRSSDLESIRGAIEDCVSSSSSLAVYSSFASLNADRDLRSFTDQKSSKPFSLLELLYEQDRSQKVNVWNATSAYNNKSTKTPNLYASDTALNFDLYERPFFGDRYGSFARRSHRNERQSSRPVSEVMRFRSCSPSINPCFSALSSIRQRFPGSKRSVDYSTRFSTPPSVPVYIQRRRKHYDSEPSSSSDASAILPSIIMPEHVSRSSTFASDIKDEADALETTDMAAVQNPSDVEIHLTSISADSNQTPDSDKLSAADATSINSLIQQTDSPRDQISSLPLRSAFLDFCQHPFARLPKFNRKMPSRLSEDGIVHTSVPQTDVQNHLFIEIATEHFNPRRRHSLTPESRFYPPESLGVQFENYRRRSLSPLSLSLLANYGSREAIDSISALQIGFQNTDVLFQRNKCTATARRRTHSMSSNGDIHQNNNGVHSVEQNGTCNLPNKPRAKPPTILIYTGDKRGQYDSIAHSLQQILPRDTYTLSHLSTLSLRSHPWIENADCLLIADTKLLDDQAWIKLQSYFVYAGKILFVCQNSLVANLTHCDSAKKQANMIKNAFGKKASSGALGKDFEAFMKKAMKTLNKSKEVNETFHATDPIGGYKFSVVLHKKSDQPLFLYMENSEHQASALFSDATTDQLLSAAGQQLIAEAISRLGIKIKHNDPLPRLTRGYLVCQNDQLVFDMDGLSYGDEIGESPKLIFRPTVQLDDISLPNADPSLLPIEVRRKKTGIPTESFNTELYFNKLRTKSLGRAFLHVPVCDTTINICKSLNRAFSNFDGIVVCADIQRAAIGRAGNQWLSPKGSVAFSFDFNVPAESELGRNIVFLQHILAVAIVDAVLSLLKLPDFPLRIKWPNDIYYGRSYKMGGVIVSASSDGNFMRCIISSGLNVANSNPTVCINNMLPANFEHQLTIEETLAEIMNKFEEHVNVFVNRGKKEFLEVYERYWLHSREEVTVIHEENGLKEKVVIRGLDPSGYLEVRSKTTGKIFSVFDSGNSFDLFKGLIRPK